MTKKLYISIFYYFLTMRYCRWFLNSFPIEGKDLCLLVQYHSCWCPGDSSPDHQQPWSSASSPRYFWPQQKKGYPDYTNAIIVFIMQIKEWLTGWAVWDLGHTPIVHLCSQTLRKLAATEKTHIINHILLAEHAEWLISSIYPKNST